MRKTTKSHGLPAAVATTIGVVALMLLLAGAILVDYFGGSDGFLTGSVLVSVGMLLAVAIGVVVALHQRWREVKRGEADEARKY